AVPVLSQGARGGARCTPTPFPSARFYLGGSFSMPTTNARPRSDAWKTAVTVLQEVLPPFIPEGAHMMTALVEFPPGDPGTPAHRHSGPVSGYMLEGE